MNRTSHVKNNLLAFTIVELIVTLLIAGILITIASVSYTSYMQRMKLAEAFSMINAFTNAEVTYYLSHKTFISFAAPMDDNGYNYTSGYGYLANVPSGGDKYKINSASSKAAGSMPGPIPTANSWAQIGKPIADNTMVSYIYGGHAGKRNSAGEAVEVTVAGHTNPLFFQSSLDAPPQILGFPERLPSGFSSALCSNTYSPEFQAMYGHGTDKSWVMLAAISNFINEADDKVTLTGWPMCTIVYKYLETGLKGNVVTGNAIITENAGH